MRQAMGQALFALEADDLKAKGAAPMPVSFLMQAAIDGDVGAMRDLYPSAGISPFSRCPQTHLRMLKAAVDHGHANVIEWLASPEMGTDINGLFLSDDHDDEGPLLHAYAASGVDRCVRTLLAAPGIDVNRTFPEDGTTPLFAASHLGHVAAVKLLLDAPGVDVNQASAKSKETPLHAAVRMADRNPAAYKEIIRALLAAPGIAPNATTFYSEEMPRVPGRVHPDWAGCRTHKATPLFLVAATVLEDSLSAALAAQLLEHPDTDPNKPNADGVSPLGVLVANGKPKTAEALLRSARIDPNLGISVTAAARRERECGMCGSQAPEGGEKLSKCAACLAVAYCCREHQKQHWKAVHKACCTQLKAQWGARKASGPQPGDEGPGNLTPLQLAIRIGRLAVARALVADERVAVGEEELGMALMAGNLDLVDLLKGKASPE